MKAIVTGMIATYPVGGTVWDYGQTALGLEPRAHDIQAVSMQEDEPRIGIDVV